MQEKKYYPIFSVNFFKALWIHMRPYLLFISGAAGLAGIAMAYQEEVEISVYEVVLTFLALFFAYGFGQALTDCFQVDTDSISAPYRPLVKGEVSPLAVGLVSLSGLLLISLVLISMNAYNIILCLLSIIGLATYTYFKKNFSFSGPFYNGWIVMLLPIMGYMSIHGGDFNSLNDPEIITLCGLTLFSYANFVLIGYLKDITADRQTGYRTFTVVYGWNKTVWVGDLFVLISIVLCFLLVFGSNWIAFVLFLIASVLAISGQLKAHFSSVKNESASAYPIISTVRAFILWHLAAIVHFYQNWWIFALGFYLLFEVVLYRRPAKGQI